jgi:hypothetical protein
MKRYHFHFKWRDDAVFDEEGIELESFAAAYVRACGLVQEVLQRFPEGGSDWWIEISSGDDLSIAVVPAMIPGANMSRAPGLVRHPPSVASRPSLTTTLDRRPPARLTHNS